MNGAIAILTALLSGGFILAFVKLYTARAQKDSIIVGSAEDLATIAKGVAESVAVELERVRKDRDDWRKRALDAERALRER